MEEINENRKEILSNYFMSIGITGAAKQQWDKLLEGVDQLENFRCNDMALK